MSRISILSFILYFSLATVPAFAMMPLDGAAVAFLAQVPVDREVELLPIEAPDPFVGPEASIDLESGIDFESLKELEAIRFEEPTLAERVYDPVNRLYPVQAEPIDFFAQADPEPSPQSREGQIEAAVQQYRKGAEAPILKRSGTVVFPFDESQPVIRCSPLRACDIELQAGETVMGVALGDSERWLTSPLESGEPNRSVPHVIVKPVGYDLATNLIIATTRRTYHLGLVSPPIEKLEKGEVAYHRHVTFYYPEEMVQRWASTEKLREVEAARARMMQAAQQRPAPLAKVARPSVQDLNFEYKIKDRRKVRWAPSTVFDDGRRVYIRMPSNIASMDLPALLVETGSGELAVPNFRVEGQWFIVEGVFERGELVLGVGWKRQRVRLVNRQLARR